jgi:hypothetical protein
MSRLAALLLILSAAFAHGAAPAPGDASAGVAAADGAEPQARIEALRAEGRRLRKEAETTYVASERLCYERFLVNQCIAEAKAQRLATIRRARDVEAEARALDLAERRRLAAERGVPAAAGAAPAPAVAAPPAAASPLPAPSPDARVEPDAAAERIRAEREAERRAAEPAAGAAREAQDAERAAARAKAEAEAAARAEEAARDRAKYDERLRRYEEEQASKKKGGE